MQETKGMENQQFKALVVEEHEGNFVRNIQTREICDLPEGEVLISVAYSSLNYKDALSAIGNKGVTKNYPHTPGIDAAGIVEASDSSEFAVGDKVIVTSYDLGMNTPGGFGEYIRVPADWIVKLPEQLSLKEAMIIGTAGLTAAISVMRLMEVVHPGDGQVLVSGATGGVGSWSVALLSASGYEVAAITGKEQEGSYLKELGAKDIVLRRAFEEEDRRPMLSAKYAGGIDTTGGTILENMIKSTAPFGAVTCCGNVAGAKLDLTVFPFILRGITLIGISSQNYPMKYRIPAWEKMADEWKSEKMLTTCHEISLEELDTSIDHILEGKLKGRTIVKL